jgi:RND family efflux transporter MFP subunit
MNIRFQRLSGSVIAAALVTLAALLSSCGGEKPKDGSAGITVATFKVAPATLPGRDTYAGTVTGRTRVTVSTKLMGVISSIPVEEGSRVTAGQVIVSIRSDDLKAKKAQVEAGRAEAGAALANVSANYERIRGLYAKKSATQKEMDDMQMAYDMAQAKVKSVDEMEKEVADLLKYADIASPLTGTIVGKYVQEGDLANPGMPLLAVEDTRELRVSFSVPESEIGSVAPGMKVGLSMDAAPAGTTIPGTIDRVNPSGDPSSRQYRVEARIEPPAGLTVRSGMYAAVTIEGAGTETIAIPESVLVRRGQLDGVFVVTAGGEALLRWVRTGEAFRDGRVEILSGLSAGEEVIATSDPRIADGVRVGAAR